MERTASSSSVNYVFVICSRQTKQSSKYYFTKKSKIRITMLWFQVRQFDRFYKWRVHEGHKTDDVKKLKIIHQPAIKRTVLDNEVNPVFIF